MAKRIEGKFTKALKTVEGTVLRIPPAKETLPEVAIGKSAAIKLPSIQKIKAQFEKTGTAIVVTGKHCGVSVKDEGDFISVRFGSNELTEIGSVPTAERNFSRKDEAFAFAEQIQNHVREILGRRSVGIKSQLDELIGK